MQTLTFLKEEKGIKYWKFEDKDQELNEHVPQEERSHIHTLIVSDTHLGTQGFRARAFLAMLNTFWIEKQFILLGDIFQDNDFKRISRAQWEVLSRIRKLSKPSKELDEIWIEGNHDNTIMAGVIGSVVGLDVQKEFTWEIGGKKYLAIHGDIFDWFLARYPLITEVVIWFYQLIELIDHNHQHIGHYLARKASEWNGEHKYVAEGAAKYGKKRGVDFVICGHTHLAMQRSFENIEYLNTGCWVKDPCSFVTITEEGPTLNYVSLE